MLSLGLLAGCSSSNSSSGTTQEKQDTSLIITGAQVTKNDGQNLDVTLTADNTTNKAIFIQTSDFALSNDSTTLSPTPQSNVPAQIPAKSNTNITLDFNVQSQLSGTIQPKIGFQPSGNQPEQFKSLGSVTIPAPKPKEVSKPVSPAKSTTTKTSTPASPSHNIGADIEHDVAVIKSKATLAVSTENGWVPIVNTFPDAAVPDGFGGMLYAWNVILDGNGDGSAQQIYFFDNAQYLGRDTKSDHLQSSVRPLSTGEIIATYGHYLPNDIMADPTGDPYIVTFRWNGNSIIPDSVATLNEAVNNQFK